MPLIDVTLRSGARLVKANGRKLSVADTRRFVRQTFGPGIPEFCIRNAAAFGMDEDTPQEGVQVQFHDYDEADVNVADLWIKFQFSEALPAKAARTKIRKALFGALAEVFHLHSLKAPDNFVIDVFWGPSTGCGNVNGTFIEW